MSPTRKSWYHSMKTEGPDQEKAWDDEWHQMSDELRAKIRNDEITPDGVADRVYEFLKRAIDLPEGRIRNISARRAVILAWEATHENED